MDFEHEPILARARTPPSRWYFDPAVLQAERERVFGRTWQLVGRDDRVGHPGDYFTARVGAESVVGDRPISVIISVGKEHANCGSRP
jgi:phenylpropionate dioxygenase-like ring-hydroxylating dioxygenase large terminal subunit